MLPIIYLNELCLNSSGLPFLIQHPKGEMCYDNVCTYR